MMFRPIALPKEVTKSTRSIVLLVSLLAWLLLFPLLKGHPLGEGILLILMFTVLIASILALSAKPEWRVAAVLLTIAALVMAGVHYFVPSNTLQIVSLIVLACFFGFTCVGLFLYLGQRDSRLAGRIYASVSLYLLIGIFWFWLYSIVRAVQSGAFTQQINGQYIPVVDSTTLLYFSFSALTTVGFGDVVAVTPFARMLSVFEAAAGVLYVAITVARLVSANDDPGRAGE